MKVHECMSRNIHLIDHACPIRTAAAIMAQSDTGIVPIHFNDQLVGVLTDRDIVVRGIAIGKGPDCPVEDLMTREVRFCYDSEDITDVARRMADIQVRRFPVVDQEKILVGIISLADIARACDHTVLGCAITGITRPGGPHSQVGERSVSELPEHEGTYS